MPTVEAKFFLLANGNDPTSCQVDNATKLVAEVIIRSEYPVPEEVTMMQIQIANVNTGACMKMFRYTGACALRTGVTYTIDTPIFGPIPVGTYGILLGFSGAPLSRSLGECGISLKEVPC
jgi:hypothetical protein